MGYWGVESCSNDHTWDQLLAEDIHNMTRGEADKTLRSVFRNEDTDEEVRLGVVIWVLAQGLFVPIQYLNMALEYIDSLLKNGAYLARWQDPGERINALHVEKIVVQNALKMKGIGQKRFLSNVNTAMSEQLLDLKKSLSDEGPIIQPVSWLDYELAGKPVRLYVFPDTNIYSALINVILKGILDQNIEAVYQLDSDKAYEFGIRLLVPMSLVETVEKIVAERGFFLQKAMEVPYA